MKQLADPVTLRRLLMLGSAGLSWQRRYFNHFSKVSDHAWKGVLADRRLIARNELFERFRAETNALPGPTPLDRISQWEARTYLTALFHQDDRMSMANSLESRVPLADPRVAEFALRLPLEFKLRSGSTKWLLRRAVSDRIPAEVLTRRKVGFDTPAVRWMRELHRDFVFDLLLSQQAKGRGWMHARNVERLLHDHSRPNWFDIVWKLTCIETWARIFIDGEVPQTINHPEMDAHIEAA